MNRGQLPTKAPQLLADNYYMQYYNIIIWIHSFTRKVYSRNTSRYAYMCTYVYVHRLNNLIIMKCMQLHLFHKSLRIIVRDQVQGLYAFLRDPKAQGCSIPSKARVLLRA